jgi:stage V sporulation protein AC
MSNKNTNQSLLEKAVNSSDKTQQEKAYSTYVKNVTPTKSLPANMFKAFFIGGLICTLGQLIMNILKDYGLNKGDCAAYTSLILIGLSALFTGLGLYSKLGSFSGAGSLVPITGFANSVASSAIEFKKEGQVFGIGCKIFTIAGPVILYGLLSSWLLGLIYYILRIWGIL